MAESEYASALIEFVRAEFLPEPERAALTPDTPLMESGILDSLRVAVLLSYIRDELGVHIPLEKLDVRNFANVRTIAGVLDDAKVAVA